MYLDMDVRRVELAGLLLLREGQGLPPEAHVEELRATATVHGGLARVQRREAAGAGQVGVVSVPVCRAGATAPVFADGSILHRQLRVVLPGLKSITFSTK